MCTVDPEFKEELAQRHKESANRSQTSSIQNFDAAGWLAGTSSKPASAPVAEKAERGKGRR